MLLDTVESALGVRGDLGTGRVNLSKSSVMTLPFEAVGEETGLLESSRSRTPEFGAVLRKVARGVVTVAVGDSPGPAGVRERLEPPMRMRVDETEASESDVGGEVGESAQGGRVACGEVTGKGAKC